jgi:hypothetical protein
MGVKWWGGAGREPFVLRDHCKNLELPRCAQNFDTGAEKGSVSVCGIIKGSGGKKMSEMVPNDGGNRRETGKNSRDNTVQHLIFYPENGGRSFVRKVCKF